MPEDLRLKIADIVFSILPTDGIKGFSLDKNYMPFKTDDEPDVVLKPGIDFESVPARQTFTTNTWNYCQADGRHVFNFFYSSKNNRPERRLVLNNGFKTGEIILGKTVRGRNGILRNPFSYPLDQLLMISLLPQMQGLLVHSCGFKYKNKGCLFIGQSGAGKSTLSQIAGRNKGVHVLNDDRIAVRKRRGSFYVYGTPWHGTEEIVSPEIAPLKGLFFLKKDTENSLREISISDTVSRLFKCSFPPLWDKKGISSTLKICEDIATSTPAFEFSFTSDDRAFEMIREKGLT